MTGWVCEVTGYPLPPGLTRYQPVTVIPSPPGTHFANVTIQDDRGGTFELYFLLVDVGHEYRLQPPYRDDGQYHHESDPRVIAYFYRQLACQWCDVPHSHGRAGWVEEMTADYRHYLTRNGYDPDHPPADLEQRAVAAERQASHTAETHEIRFRRI